MSGPKGHVYQVVSAAELRRRAIAAAKAFIESRRSELESLAFRASAWPAAHARVQALLASMPTGAGDDLDRLQSDAQRAQALVQRATEAVQAALNQAASDAVRLRRFRTHRRHRRVRADRHDPHDHDTSHHHRHRRPRTPAHQARLPRAEIARHRPRHRPAPPRPSATPPHPDRTLRRGRHLRGRAHGRRRRQRRPHHPSPGRRASQRPPRQRRPHLRPGPQAAEPPFVRLPVARRMAGQAACAARRARPELIQIDAAFLASLRAGRNLDQIRTSWCRPATKTWSCRVGEQISALLSEAQLDGFESFTDNDLDAVRDWASANSPELLAENIDDDPIAWISRVSLRWLEINAPFYQEIPSPSSTAPRRT